MNTRTLPSLFVSHGSPMLALEPGAAGAFMQALGPAIDQTFGRPRAVVVASAHSLIEEPPRSRATEVAFGAAGRLMREPALLAAPRHHTVHDFGGWVLIEGTGPYEEQRDVLLGITHALRSARDSIDDKSSALGWYFNVTLATLCGAAREGWGDKCPLPAPDVR